MLRHEPSRAVPLLLLTIFAPASAASAQLAHDVDWWQARAEEIVAREWASLDAPPPWAPRKPQVTVAQEEAVRAGARVVGVANGEPFETVLSVSTGLVERLVGDDMDALACILGHEIGHIALGHHRRDRAAQAPGQSGKDSPIGATATREMEHSCDLFGARLAARAGYDPAGLLRGLERMRNRLGEGASWEALPEDHPDAGERLAALNRARPGIARAAVSFEVGAEMLRMGNDVCAREALTAAAKLFPDAPEVLGRLGRAEVLTYFYSLPAFYWEEHDKLYLPMPTGLSACFPGPSRTTGVPGVPEELRALWREAVGHLEQALTGGSGDAEAPADLGLAHLIAPDGPEHAAAGAHLVRAQELAAGDAALAPAILNNRALCALLAGDRELAHSLLREASAAFPSGRNRVNTPEANLALLTGESADPDERRRAAESLEGICKGLPPTSAQWHYLHTRYRLICASAGRPALAEESLRTGTQRRTTVHLSRAGQTIELGQSLELTVQQLGAPDAAIPAGTGGQEPGVDPEGASIVVYRHPEKGLELVFFHDRLVRAQVRATPESGGCAAVLRTDGNTEGSITIGDPLALAASALSPYDEPFALGEAGSRRCYPALGFTLDARDGKIQAMVLTKGVAWAGERRGPYMPIRGM